VLFGGDLFHTPDVAKSVINDVIPIFKSWNKRIIGVVGSHDYFGYQMKSLKRTALGHFVEFGLIELVGGGLDGIPDYIPLGNAYSQAVITGTHHAYDLNEKEAGYYKEKYGREDQMQIQLVHGDLLEKHAVWSHTLVSDVDTESDLVLSGHYHPGWPGRVILGRDGMLFVNPGSIARLENTGVHRMPAVCIIDTEKLPEVRFIELQRAAPHPFKERTGKTEENTMQDVSKLLQLVESIQIEPVDIKAQLPRVAKELGYGEATLECAFDLIEKAKQ
jgi:predicted phosphodiesterase